MPASLPALAEAYRPGLGIDREHDEADRAAGRRVRSPTLVAWSVHDDLEERWGDPVAIWREWADDVRGARIDSGHHMAEEAPDQLAAVLGEFFSGSAWVAGSEGDRSAA
jgi:haloacetate dehalogenase